MNKIQKILLIIFGPIALIIILIILAGIYKFNFTNDDIYLEKNNKLIQYDEYKKLYPEEFLR